MMEQYLIMPMFSSRSQVEQLTFFYKITIYFGISRTFISGYIYITLKQKVENVVTVEMCKTIYIYIQTRQIS